MRQARCLTIRGVVQGVGFRPFVFRLAKELGIEGWVLNDGDGVTIHAEGEQEALDLFVRQLEAQPPPAARIASLDVSPAEILETGRFEIRESEGNARPTVNISPDLPVCEACLRELFDPGDRRYGYPYINCTDCGPRFSILLGLPYDRPRRPWPPGRCAPTARGSTTIRSTAGPVQPVACPVCGPKMDGIPEAARLLSEGAIVAVRG